MPVMIFHLTKHSSFFTVRIEELLGVQDTEKRAAGASAPAVAKKISMMASSSQMDFLFPEMKPGDSKTFIMDEANVSDEFKDFENRKTAESLFEDYFEVVKQSQDARMLDHFHELQEKYGNAENGNQEKGS